MIGIIFHIVPALMLTGFMLSARAQEVSVPDPGLNAAIREALQKPSGPLIEQDRPTLTDLSAYDYPDSSCRSASRLFATPFHTDADLGLRVVLAGP